MTDSGMIFRAFRPEDKNAVLTLLRESFEGWHGDVNEAYWEWKFERNPHGPARIWVCDDGGAIAGCYILNPARINLGRTLITGAQSVDAAVHPAHQGRGIFTSMVRTATAAAAGEGIDVVFAFPSEAAYGGQVRSDFRDAFPVPTVYRSLAAPHSSRHKLSDAFSFRIVESFDPRFDALGQGGERELTPRRDADYLEWRYNQNPLTEYEIVVCEKGDALCGYAVFSVAADRRLSPGHIVDFQVRPGFGAAATPLLRETVRLLRSRGARVAVTWARPASAEQDAIQSCGFSGRYVALRRRIERSKYVAQFIVYDVGTVPALKDTSLPWSLVEGDADYG